MVLLVVCIQNVPKLLGFNVNERYILYDFTVTPLSSDESDKFYRGLEFRPQSYFDVYEKQANVTKESNLHLGFILGPPGYGKSYWFLYSRNSFQNGGRSLLLILFQNYSICGFQVAIKTLCHVYFIRQKLS